MSPISPETTRGRNILLKFADFRSLGDNPDGRLVSVDVAKGIAISLVAFFHTTGGFVTAGILPNSAPLTFTTTFAYAFHVHVFFIIAGYFSNGLRQAKKLRGRLLSLYYSYLLWSIISIFAGMIATTTNNSYTYYDLMVIPFWPILHYWFILSLMVGLAALFIFRKQPALIISAVVALASSIFLKGWLHDTAYFYSFMVAGELLARNGVPLICRPWIASLCFLFLVSGVCLAIGNGLTGSQIRIAPFILFSFAGCYMLFWFSQVITPTWLGHVFAYVGEASLAIYLIHVLAAAGLRILLFRIDPFFNGVLGVVICFAASIVLPLVIKETASRFALSSLLALSPLKKPG